VVQNILVKKPYINHALVLILEGKDLGVEVAKASVMTLTEEDIVFLSRHPESAAVVQKFKERGHKSKDAAVTENMERLQKRFERESA
jgi:hypothetical protein